MQRSRGAAVMLAALWMTSIPVLAAESLGLATRTGLQVAMQRHIDAALIEGSYLHLDPDSGAVTSLLPAEAHPKILRMGTHFVLCTTFLDTEGTPHNVDFYVAPDGGDYSVYAALVENRELVKRLMAEGKVERAD